MAITITNVSLNPNPVNTGNAGIVSVGLTEYFTVSFTATNGTVSTATIINVPAGTTWSVSGNTVTITGMGSSTATASSGYAFSAWNYSGSGTVTDDMTFTATCILDTFTVTFSAGTGGSLNKSTITVQNGVTYASSSNVITFSDGQTVTATASTGYRFGSWSPSSGTITANTTITASFNVRTFIVTFSAGVGGSLSRYSITNIPYGSSISKSGNTITINGTTVTATPESSYSLYSWSNSSGTITANRTITAVFAVVFTVDNSNYLSTQTITVHRGSTIYFQSSSDSYYGYGMRGTETSNNKWEYADPPTIPKQGNWKSYTGVTYSWSADYGPYYFRSSSFNITLVLFSGQITISSSAPTGSFNIQKGRHSLTGSADNVGTLTVNVVD